MWNWLVTVLASKASILLFDGFPMYKKPDLLLKIANQEKVSLFGVSAKYIDALRKSDVNIKNKFKLKYLKTIKNFSHHVFNRVRLICDIHKITYISK